MLKAALGPEAVHLCIDMQRLFAAGGPWATPWMERVLPAVVTLAGHAPARTVFTRFIPPQSADDAPGMWRAYYSKWPTVTRERVDAALLELIPALEKFVPPAGVFDKGVYSAFATGELHPFLLQKGINTLVVTGSETDVCVLSTVLAAVDLGYRVIVVQDAVCSSCDESHDALIDLYNLRFDVQIESSTSDEVLAQWRV
jgi:nicotinamidase-related amidase